MIENTESLLPKIPLSGRPLRAVTIGLDAESLNEMDRLLYTLGVETVDRVIAPVRRVVAGTYFGTGKLDSIREKWQEHEDDEQDTEHDPEHGPAVDFYVIDVELSPKQLQNTEKLLCKTVLDRAAIILEIFSRHAQTREAKTQVELAKLQYVLPRLAHLWSHFERQRGGGVGNKGMGEKQIEVDRRLVKRRISLLRERLKQIEKERTVQRASRQDLFKVALVGYTNAGKSTLLNALTHSHVLSEDKLFATLDATVRALSPDSHPPVVAIDTVGFIQRIPTNLIASFRSTLEEIVDADLILQVLDASSPQMKEQYETTIKVLEELGCAEKEKIVVLNKADLLKTPAEVNQARLVYPGAVRLSAFDTPAVLAFREKILDHFRERMETWELVLPYSEGKLQAQIQEFGTITQTRFLEAGIFFQVKLDSSIARKLGVQRYATGIES